MNSKRVEGNNIIDIMLRLKENEVKNENMATRPDIIENNKKLVDYGLPDFKVLKASRTSQSEHSEKVKDNAERLPLSRQKGMAYKNDRFIFYKGLDAKKRRNLYSRPLNFENAIIPFKYGFPVTIPRQKSKEKKNLIRMNISDITNTENEIRNIMLDSPETSVTANENKTGSSIEGSRAVRGSEAAPKDDNILSESMLTHSQLKRVERMIKNHTLLPSSIRPKSPEVIKEKKTVEISAEQLEIKRIKSENRALCKEVDKLETIKRENRAELEKRTVLINDLEDQLEILRRLTWSHMSRLGIGEDEKKIMALFTLRHSQSDEIEILTDKLKAKDEEIEKMSEKYSSLLSENNSIYRTLETNKEYILKMNEKMENSKVKNSKFNRDSSEAKKYQEEFKELSEKYSALVSKYEEMNKTLEVNKIHILKIDKENEKLKEKNRKLSDSLSRAQKYQEEYAKLLEKHNSLLFRYKNINKTLEANKEYILKINEEIVTYKEKNRKSSHKSSQARIYKEELAKLLKK